MTDAQPAADPSTLDELHRQVASATGAARAGVDVAEHGTRHTARQIVFALAQGAADDLELRTLLRGLATESERLSGDAVRLHSRLRDAERTTNAAAETGNPHQLTAALSTLEAVHADGLALLSAAGAVRRRLPRAYGDPLELDSDWPTAEEESDAEQATSGEPDSYEAHLKATVAVALDVRAAERRLAALRELVEFIEEAESPGTFHGGSMTLLFGAYELGVVSGKTVGTPSDPGTYRLMLSEPTPENGRATQGEGVNGNPSAAEYLRAMIMANLAAETAEPRFDTIREIARLISEVPASPTLQRELITVLASAHEVGRRHGADGTRPGLG